jgi:hypothetical protein
VEDEVGDVIGNVVATLPELFDHAGPPESWNIVVEAAHDVVNGIERAVLGRPETGEAHDLFVGLVQAITAEDHRSIMATSAGTRR